MSPESNLLSQAARATFLLPPRGRVGELSGGRFLLAALVFMLAGIAWESHLVPAPRGFNGWALSHRMMPVGAALLIAWLIERLVQRRRIALRLAAVGLLAALPWTLFWAWVAALDFSSRSTGFDVLPLSMIAVAALSVQLARWSGWPTGWWRRGALVWVLATAATSVTLLTSLPPWWWKAEADEVSAVRAPPFNAEEVMYAQPGLLASALTTLSPERPGKVDLYALGFAGDGSESVFRNEVLHFEQLVATRLAPGTRAIALINHPETVDRYPLASMTNLRQALTGIAARMNREEDVLLMFLTSHGSEDHELYVDLDPLPLDQIRPQDLRKALDQSGIRWRVLIISACYAGGFIPELERDDTLVLTAARKDRPSFGCGHDSKLTWFGRAFLVDGLNQNSDFVQAFDAAKRSVQKRERREKERPSYPQIALGKRIAEQLAHLRADNPAGPAVRFTTREQGAD